MDRQTLRDWVHRYNGLGPDGLDDARRKLALWRYDYNNVRPHSSLANQTPADARRAPEQSEGSAPGALAQPEANHYQPQGLSL